MSARRLRPTGNRILVKPLEPSTQTRGGIMLPESYQTPSGQAVILAVGGRVMDESLKPGAVVFYSWINGREVEHNEQKCVLLDVPNILGVQTSE